VGIGPNDQGGFALQVALTATLPRVDQEAADRIVAAAHQVCPYSNATRGNIDVTLRAVGS
jgi:lipoyl-dependent peroxiredoxin